jgi:UDP-GlcNAc:undecaprenyl-phosphate/decaprenyl-phosphate GlcNAc-1-phosphate transferase
MINRLMLSSMVAFIVSAVTVWATCKIAIKKGLVDPIGPLKVHRGPIPRLGGIGIFFGFLAGSLAAIRPVQPEEWKLAPALLLIWLSGLFDDVFQLSPTLRLAIQIIAGLTVYHSGLHTAQNAPEFLCAIKTCLTIIVFTNAFNFLDGSDGLAAGSAVIAAIGFAILMARQTPAWSAVAVAIAAATCGFLVFNFPPASIFMGDSGSTVLGFVFALLALRFDFSVSHTSLIPLIIVAIPLVDFGLAVFRRLSSGRSPFEGDRSHFYDLLLQKGWSPRKVALCTYVAVTCCVALALTLR